MPSSYSSSLRLELIGSGEQAGAWGNTTNKNLGTLLEEAIAGVLTIQMPANADYTLTVYNGASDQARQAALIITSAVSLTTTRNIIIPAKDKVYIVRNSTSGSQDIVVKTASGTGVTIPNGKIYLLYCDGTNVSTINTAGELGNVTSYNGQTGDVVGVSTLLPDIGISIVDSGDIGSKIVKNTGVTSLTFENSSGVTNASGGIIVESADIISTLGYTPIDKYGADGLGNSLATGNWGINANTATKFKYSLGEAPAIATRAWVNIVPPAASGGTNNYTSTPADISGVTLTQSASTTVTATIPSTSLTTISGTYTQWGSLIAASYVQGTSLTGTFTYKQGLASPKTGTYTQSGTVVTVTIPAGHGIATVGTKIRVTITGVDTYQKVVSIPDSTHFTYNTTSGSGSGSISVDYASTRVTVTCSDPHGLPTTLSGVQTTVSSGVADTGSYDVTTDTLYIFHYTAAFSRLTGGTMSSVKKPSTLITVTTDVVHGLTIGDTIYVPSSSETFTVSTIVSIKKFTVNSNSLTPTISPATTTTPIYYVAKGTIVTVTTLSAHGLLDGEKVYMSITGGGSTPGVYTIDTVSSDTTFTYKTTNSNSKLIVSGGTVDFVNNGPAANQIIYLEATVSLSGVSTNISGWYSIVNVTGLYTFTFSRATGTMSGVNSGTLNMSYITGSYNVAYVARATALPTGFIDHIVNFKVPMNSATYCVNCTGSYDNYPPRPTYTLPSLISGTYDAKNYVYVTTYKSTNGDVNNPALNSNRYNYVSIVQ